MKKFVSMIIILVMAACLMVPVFASAQSVVRGDYMWVNCADGKRLNVRTQPAKNASLVCRIDCGTQVEIVDDIDGTWALIALNGKPTGYVMSRFLVASKPGKYEITERDDNFVAVTPYTVQALARGKNTDQSVGLRVKPNKTAQAIRRLQAGDELEVIARGNTWSKVRDFFTGKVGFVANDYIARV